MTSRLTIAALAVYLGLGAATPAAAQALKNKNQAAKQAKQAEKAINRLPPNRVAQIDRLANMPPEQREKALSRLPPERRERIENQLARYQSLTPEQRQRVQQRYQAFQGLPAARQDAVRQELQLLRGLRPVERRQRVMSDEWHQNFSPEEQKLLRESLGQVNRF